MFINTMYTLKEMKHELKANASYVILFRGTYHGSEEYYQKEGKLDFTWVEYDQDGNQTGTTTSCKEDGVLEIGKTVQNEDGTKDVLEISFGNVEENDILFICPAEEYAKTMDDALAKREQQLLENT